MKKIREGFAIQKLGVIFVIIIGGMGLAILWHTSLNEYITTNNSKLVKNLVIGERVEDMDQENDLRRELRYMEKWCRYD